MYTRGPAGLRDGAEEETEGGKVALANPKVHMYMFYSQIPFLPPFPSTAAAQAPPAQPATKSNPDNNAG